MKEFFGKLGTSKLVLTLALGLLLSACGEDNRRNVRFNGERGPYKDAIAFLEATQIFSPEGNEIVPSNENGRSPFAMFFYLPRNSTSYGTCSAAHIRYGIVATAAHCLESNPDKEDYFVVYYDKTRVKKWAKIDEIEFIGDDNNFDMAILKVTDEIADEWDHLSGLPTDYSSQFNGDTLKPEYEDKPPLEIIKMWVFNPIKHHDKIQEAYPTAHGGVFDPKLCYASRRKPTIEKTSGVNTMLDLAATSWSSAQKYTSFMDNCTYPIVKGNSGGLITSYQNSSHLVSVVSRFVRYEDTEDRYYTGNLNKRISYTQLVAHQRQQWNKGDRDWTITYGDETIDYTLTAYAMGTVFDALSEFKSILTSAMLLAFNN